MLVLRLVGLLCILVTPTKSPRNSCINVLFLFRGGLRQLNLLCIDVGAFGEQNDLLCVLLLLDGFVKIEHAINDLDVLRPVPLDVDVPGHGQDPADARDAPHPLLQDQLGVVSWPCVVEAGPEKIPISPESLKCFSFA